MWNGIYVWLDDERPIPPGFDIQVKTASEAIALLESGTVGYISLDHDLGGDETNGTGYTVAKWIEEAAYNGKLKEIGLALHTANPVGRQKMAAALQNAKRYWSNNNG